MSPIPDEQAGPKEKKKEEDVDATMVFDICNAYLGAMIRGTDIEIEIFGKGWEAMCKARESKPK